MERYEHHADIMQNKLCPFKLRHVMCVEDVFNWHKNVEIIYVTDGEGYVHHGIDTIPLKKGDIALISPNVMHRFYSSGEFMFYYFIVDDRFWAENGIDITQYSLDQKVCDEKLNALYLAVVKAYENKKAEESDMSVPLLRSAVLNFLCYILLNYSKQVEEKASVSASDEYIKRAITYLGEHYTESVTLDEIAAFCKVSRFHLAREFKKYTGHTVITHINIMRCKKADACLVGGMTVTEAACECGFDSVSYFSRTYKKLMGNLPSSIKRA